MCAPSSRAGAQAACSAARKRSSSPCVELDAEAAQQLADHLRVFDLLDRARDEEQRQVPLAEDPGRSLGAGEAVALERAEPGLPAGGQELLVVGEVKEGVPPVEEHGVEHAARG